MRSYDENDAYDREEAARLGAAAWQLDLLARNPAYVLWGPGEDYMEEAGTGKGRGWSSSLSIPSWKEFDWTLDDLNECVNFYFSIERKSTQCPKCGPLDSEGYHPDSVSVWGTFYPPECVQRGIPITQAWYDKITDDEAAALVAARRGKPGMTARDFNAAERNRTGFGHDAINRGILIEQRCKRLGLPVQCDLCGGHAKVFTAPEPHVVLTLWMLVPRKGCSRGVRVEHVAESDLPSVFAWLRTAQQRNHDRFSGIPDA